MAKPTQDHILISELKDNIALLKDGSACTVLQTSAVNFGLLSQEEQLAIISAFAQTLNSLAFAVQIVIYSKRLDISSYIKLLDQSSKLQTNPLLSSMIDRYKSFIQSLIKEHEVLDKKFYVVINISPLEIGIGLNEEDRLKKIKAIITPRKDQITRQLARVGVKTTQLEEKQLIELFYEIYNQPVNHSLSFEIQPQATPQAIPVKPALPAPPNTPKTAPILKPPQPPVNQSVNNQPPVLTQRSKTHPFIVEELMDTI